MKRVFWASLMMGGFIMSAILYRSVGIKSSGLDSTSGQKSPFAIRNANAASTMTKKWVTFNTTCN